MTRSELDCLLYDLANDCINEDERESLASAHDLIMDLYDRSGKGNEDMRLTINTDDIMDKWRNATEQFGYSPYFALCRVRFNENGGEEDLLISFVEEDCLPMDYTDEDVFHYADDINDLIELTYDDNGEDFKVVGVYYFLGD